MRKSWRQISAVATAAVLSIAMMIGWAPTDGTPMVVASLFAAAVALTINETVSDRRDRETRAEEKARKEELKRQERLAEVAAQDRAVEAERREREIQMKLREQREHAYSEVIAHLVSSFTTGPTHPESYIRSKIAIWGSAQFIESYIDWKSSLKGLAGRGIVNIPEERRVEIVNRVSQLVLAARVDLQMGTGDTLPTQMLTAALFDDPKLQAID